jgi:hypothetical protein
MAAVTSTFKNPDSTFVWWIEGDKIAIATTEGDADTRNTQLGQYKAAVIGSGSDYVENGMLISYYAEPDEYISMTAEIDIDNAFHPAIICYVKAKALMDKAAATNNPQLAQIKMANAQALMAEYKEMVRKFGAKRRDKTAGTRAVVPANMR